jgi:WD40 repeat protein
LRFRSLGLSTAAMVATMMGACREPPLGPDQDQAALGSGATALTAPSNLSAAGVSSSRVDLTWQDKSSNESGFEIHRSTSGAGGPFALLAKTGVNVTSYSNSGLKSSQQYCYRVRALKTSGSKTTYSAFSSTSCATTSATAPPPPPPPPPPPSELQVEARTIGVDLDVDGYEIFVVEAGGRVQRASLPVNGTVKFSDVRRGTVSVELRGDAPNCFLTTPPSQLINYQASITVAFELTCGRSTPIAYASTIDGNAEIYTINSNGTGRATRLTSHPASDVEPAWSPDGGRIAFRSDRDGNSEIYVMSADGFNPMRLTTDPAQDESPTWAPDGARIAFVSNRDSQSRIYVMNADGSNVSATNQAGSSPAWSPDGQRIAFSFGPIYVMNPDGTAATRLTNPFNDGVIGHMYEYDTSPDWSPDGGSVLFARVNCDGFGYGCSHQVMRVSAAGSTEEAVSFYYGYAGTNEGEPVWSPEGRKVAFVDVDSIVVLRGDGTNQVSLTAGFGPAWRR